MLTRQCIQDCEKKSILVGGDVVGLYPNMDTISTAELSARAMEDSDVRISGVDYTLLAIYLFLVLGPITTVNLGLGTFVPRRLVKFKGKFLVSTQNLDKKNWFFNEELVSEKEKKAMLAQMLKIGNLVTMNTTCYSLGGRIFRQSGGAGIGLRSSAGCKDNNGILGLRLGDDSKYLVI